LPSLFSFLSPFVPPTLSCSVQEQVNTALNMSLPESNNKLRIQYCALLGHYSASSGNFLPTFRGLVTPEDGTDRLSRNVVKKLPLLAA
jgi:hypothetical protein